MSHNNTHTHTYSRVHLLLLQARPYVSRSRVSCVGFPKIINLVGRYSSKNSRGRVPPKRGTLNKETPGKLYPCDRYTRPSRALQGLSTRLLVQWGLLVWGLLTSNRILFLCPGRQALIFDLQLTSRIGASAPSGLRPLCTRPCWQNMGNREVLDSRETLPKRQCDARHFPMLKD